MTMMIDIVAIHIEKVSIPWFQLFNPYYIPFCILVDRPKVCGCDLVHFPCSPINFYQLDLLVSQKQIYNEAFVKKNRLENWTSLDTCCSQMCIFVGFLTSYKGPPVCVRY